MQDARSHKHSDKRPSYCEEGFWSSKPYFAPSLSIRKKQNLSFKKSDHHSPPKTTTGTSYSRKLIGQLATEVWRSYLETDM